MEEKKTRKEMQKTQVYNVIILDRSGSMSSIRLAAVQGFNETLAGIKKAQEQFADTQDHFVTLVTFCSCGNNYVLDKVPAADAKPLRDSDYQPCCCTPLYDAMGFTLTAMRKHVRNMEDVVVVVTVITDGMENASKEYSGKAVKLLVESLRGEGWTFTYMGANQDSVEVASSLSIRNARNFDCSSAGTLSTMGKDRSTRMNFFTRLSGMKMAEANGDLDGISPSERHSLYTAMADDAFDEEEAQ